MRVNFEKIFLEVRSDQLPMRDAPSAFQNGVTEHLENCIENEKLNFAEQPICSGAEKPEREIRYRVKCVFFKKRNDGYAFN